MGYTGGVPGCAEYLWQSPGQPMSVDSGGFAPVRVYYDFFMECICTLRRIAYDVCVMVSFRL